MLFSSHWKGQSPPSVPVLVSLTTHSGSPITVDARKITDHKLHYPTPEVPQWLTTLIVDDEAVSVTQTPLQIKQLVDAELELLSAPAVVAEVEMPAGWIILTVMTGKAIYLRLSSITGVLLHDPTGANDPVRCCVYCGSGNAIWIKESIDDVLTLLRSEVPHGDR